MCEGNDAGVLRERFETEFPIGAAETPDCKGSRGAQAGGRATAASRSGSTWLLMDEH